MVAWSTKFKIGRKWAVNAYEEHKESINKIINLLPKDFKSGMENWTGQIEQHISDTIMAFCLGFDRKERMCSFSDWLRRR